MDNRVIFEDIRKLVTFYAYAENQYCHASLLERSPIIREFLEFRAFERMHFIEELEYAVNLDSAKTCAELYDWHVQVYGRNPLSVPVFHPQEFRYPEEKALEICVGLLALNLPDNPTILLWKHVCKIEACLLSMAYLSALFENRYR
jgi:hypothetical protein